MREVRVTGPLARELELRAKAEEFYNQCHGKGGLFCQGPDGPGRVRDNGGRLQGNLTEEESLSMVPEAARESLQHLYDRRAEAESTYTPALEALARENGGQLVGLDQRFKSPKSVANRVERNMNEGEDAQTAADLGDSLRYTMVLPDDKYAEGVRGSIEEISNAGVKFDGNKVMNSWAPNDQYDGINSTMIDPSTGLKIELQFHTAESFAAKESLHPQYEILRDYKTDTSRSDADRYQTWQEMVDRNSSLSTPPGALDIQGDVNGVDVNWKQWPWYKYAKNEQGPLGPGFQTIFPDPRAK